MSSWKVLSVLAASALLGAFTASFAAEPEKDPPAARDSSPTKSAEGVVDHVFVACLMREAENEVAVARFAQKQAKDKSVQDFAEKMAKEHTACLTKLAKFTGQSAAANARDDRDNDRDRKADTKGPPVATMIAIHNELARKCLATTLRELGQKEGAEFDRCYMGHQIYAHLKMADTLDVYKKHCGSELRELITEAEKTTQEHLTLARKTMKELESAESKTSAK